LEFDLGEVGFCGCFLIGVEGRSWLDVLCFGVFYGVSFGMFRLYMTSLFCNFWIVGLRLPCARTWFKFCRFKKEKKLSKIIVWDNWLDIPSILFTVLALLIPYTIKHVTSLYHF